MEYPYYGGFGWNNYFMVMDLDGDTLTDLDTEVWIWWIWLEQSLLRIQQFYGGQGYNRNYPTMQVEEVQSTPMTTRIEILVLETTTIMNKVRSDYGEILTIVTILETMAIILTREQIIQFLDEVASDNQKTQPHPRESTQDKKGHIHT
jgi:hypothetical protein